jgi:hypothetical protein
MVVDPVQRLNYYQFQYVGAEDFRDQQAYHRDALRRHELGPHSWGIVTGLSILEVPREGDDPFVDIHVLPGIAVDGFGRKIGILEPVKVDPELFGAFNTDRYLELWVRYDEAPARTATGGFAPCTDADAYSRVTETYRFLVGSPQDRDALMVGGDEAKLAAAAAPGDPIEPADGSVPYQDFPDEERAARWPVRLGTVHWDGTVRKFSKAADPKTLADGRAYAGLVGGSLLAEGPGLRLAPRAAAADRDLADFASIEGRLRVDGRIVAKKDILVHGGKVSWQSTGGSDETRPLWMQRLPAQVGVGADLRIHIGDAANADTRLTVGPGPNPAAEQVMFAVSGDDKVLIPTGQLRFDGGPRQLIDLSVAGGELNGIGRHNSSVYYRSSGDHYWHGGGAHADNNGDPGGGTLLMRLSAQGSLYFANTYRQIINANVGGQSFGVGVQDQTLYMRSPSNFAWYQGGGHGSGQLDPGGGAEAMRIDGTSRLTVQGGVRSMGRVELWGTALDFRTATGSTDTDIMEIQRVNNGADSNDLRITIGDNLGGGDRLIVGPRYAGDGIFREQLVVENNGDVRVGRDLYVGNRKALVDVLTGEIVLNQMSGGSGQTSPIWLQSQALATVSEVQIVLALSDIGNNAGANDARWRVKVANKVIQPPNSVSFRVDWVVGDSDGQLFSLSYVAIFRP